ncbi:hypothetical protein [Ferrovibrio terrae]|uniref:hypothetical protein n=1 Tax=Ferrovibrio terrae TaxID=2594003 RepID=UPI0031381E80
MGVQSEIVIPRYVVLTKLAGSWIPRASLGDAERAEAEAFRWRRIYGPDHTRVAEFLLPETRSSGLPAIVTVPVLPVRAATARPLVADKYEAWRNAGLRALALYLGFGFATRAMDLLILLAQH